MANRAYLQCLEGRTQCEIVATYSLPSAWLDLFGPEDFHTGNECSIKNACRPTTTTYLLAPAPVALARFKERMTRAKIKLHGDGLTARVYEWLTTHFAEGWLFADTTELEWMSDDFIPFTRKCLQDAGKRVRRWELTDRSFLLELGWGTGISSEEVKRELERAKLDPFDVTTLEGRPYRMEDTYEVGDTVAHRIFGSGKVRAASESKITVHFPIGVKTLVHRKQ